MNTRIYFTSLVTLAFVLGASLASAQEQHSAQEQRSAQNQPSNSAVSDPASSQQKGSLVSLHATGTFDVKITPQSPEDKVGDPSIGRMDIDKQFHGELEATSRGQMLAAMTETKGSAGYVALERVNGTLAGRKGTFVLQHTGTMSRGVPGLIITVVPDSGTGELAGLTGKMDIQITDGKHSYTFDYTLPEGK